MRTPLMLLILAALVACASEEDATPTFSVADSVSTSGWSCGHVPAAQILEIGEDYALAVRRDDADAEYVGGHDIARWP